MVLETRIIFPKEGLHLDDFVILVPKINELAEAEVMDYGAKEREIEVVFDDNEFVVGIMVEDLAPNGTGDTVNLLNWKFVPLFNTSSGTEYGALIDEAVDYTLRFGKGVRCFSVQRDNLKETKYLKGKVTTYSASFKLLDQGLNKKHSLIYNGSRIVVVDSLSMYPINIGDEECVEMRNTRVLRFVNSGEVIFSARRYSDRKIQLGSLYESKQLILPATEWKIIKESSLDRLAEQLTNIREFCR